MHARNLPSALLSLRIRVCSIIPVHSLRSRPRVDFCGAGTKLSTSLFTPRPLSFARRALSNYLKHFALVTCFRARSLKRQINGILWINSARTFPCLDRSSVNILRLSSLLWYLAREESSSQGYSKVAQRDPEVQKYLENASQPFTTPFAGDFEKYLFSEASLSVDIVSARPTQPDFLVKLGNVPREILASSPDEVSRDSSSREFKVPPPLPPLPSSRLQALLPRPLQIARRILTDACMLFHIES